MGTAGSGVGRSWAAEGEHVSVGCRNQRMPREPRKRWGAAGRLAQPLWSLGCGMDRCPMGAATLQPPKTALQKGYLGRGGAGTCLRRTVRRGDAVNWGFIEVLRQSGLHKGYLFGPEKPQWTSSRWRSVGDAGGTQVMPAHSCFPPGHTCSKSPGGAGSAKPRPGCWLPAWRADAD